MRSANSVAWIDLIKSDFAKDREARENKCSYRRQINIQKKLVTSRQIAASR